MKQPLVDTNVFIRYFTHEVGEQYDQAKALISRAENGELEIYISLMVINEIWWILEKFYNMERSLYIPQLLHLLMLDTIKVIETKKEIVFEVLEKMIPNRIDFTDIYLVTIVGTNEIISFDKDIKKLQES
jgi:predicted nucleic acid-binding protein